MRGRFYVFEAGDHAGKTTQIQLLKKRCEAEGRKVIFTREPGGTPLADKIRSLILDPENPMAPETEAYLYAASRAEHAKQIEQWINDGYDVFCDRFVYSSIVYQGFARGLGDLQIRSLNSLAIANLKSPDKVFYLRISKEAYLERKKGMSSLDRLEQESLDFFGKVLAGYDKVFDQDMYLLAFNRLHVLDAERSVEDLHEEIWAVYNETLKEEQSWQDF